MSILTLVKLLGIFSFFLFWIYMIVFYFPSKERKEMQKYLNDDTSDLGKIHWEYQDDKI